MASFNYSTMQMTAKIVYYGPGLCGKTTNLQHIYDHTTGDSRGEMVSLETQTDRTLFFDLLPIEVGTIAGFNTRIQLYTVPGQVFYNTTRKLVLKGVDGVVFVADSQRPMLPANKESFANLEANLAELGILIGAIPLVLQYNKRDLPNVCTIEELEAELNRGDFPSRGASAINGEGVFETLRAVSKVTLVALKKQLEEGAPGTSPLPTRPAARAPRAALAGPPRPAVAQEASAAGSGRPSFGSNGDGKAKRSLLLELEKPDFERVRRLNLSLQVQDAENRLVHEERGIRVELDHQASLEELLLQLKIRPRARD